MEDDVAAAANHKARLAPSVLAGDTAPFPLLKKPGFLAPILQGDRYVEPEGEETAREGGGGGV